MQDFFYLFLVSIFHPFRKLKLKESRDEEEEDEVEDTFNDAIEAFESGAVHHQPRERKISIIDP